MKKLISDRSIFSWALYDWANSAFATTVVAGFFPIFFKEYWSIGVPATTSTFYLGMGNSVSGLCLAILAPVLGSLGDRCGYKKELLFLATLMGALGSAVLFFIPEGQWFLAILVYAIAGFGFAAAMTPYDSLLVDVSQKKNMDQISGFGYALGYLGGGILFLFNVSMVLYPEIYGISGKVAAIKLSFLSVAIWWVAFSLPLFINVKEAKETTDSFSLKILRSCWKDVFTTFKDLLVDRKVFLFLLAYFFYIEGVNTTIRMAVDYGLSLGFPSESLIVALLIVQFVAFPFAIFFGWFGSRFGAVTGIYICIFVYILMSLLAFQMTVVREFYLMAVAIGSVQGGIQSLSRSYFADNIPADKSAQYFGFYNMLGKFSAVLGPLLIAVTVASSGSSRMTVVVLLFLFCTGLSLLALSRSTRFRN